MSLLEKYFCQFFQIHACESKPDFHSHAGFTVHLCISESMRFFRCSEDSLDRFLSAVVNVPHSDGVSDVFADFHVIFPKMSADDFDVVFAMRALAEIRTGFAYFRTAFVFTIAFSVSG